MVWSRLLCVAAVVLATSCSSPTSATDAAADLDLGADASDAGLGDTLADGGAPDLGVDQWPALPPRRCKLPPTDPPPTAPPRDKPLGRLPSWSPLLWTTEVSSYSGESFEPAHIGQQVVFPVRWEGAVALDLKGTMRWQANGANTNPKLFDTAVYPHGSTIAFATPEGTVVLVDQDGKRLWEQNQLGPFVDYGFPNILAMLRLPDGSVVAGTSGQRLFRISPTGNVLWSVALPGVTKGLWRGRDGEIVVNAWTALVGVDPQGRLLWRTWPQLPAHSSSVAAVAGAASGRMLFLWSHIREPNGPRSYYLFALDPSCGRITKVADLPCGGFRLLVDERGTLITGQICTGPPQTEYRLYAYRPDGKLSWKVSLPYLHTIQSMVLGSDGSLYVVDNYHAPRSGQILRVDTTTGQWATIYNKPGYRFWGPPLLLPGGLLIVGGAGPYPYPASQVVAIQVRSPRLMPNAWPRRGGDNANTLAF